MFCVMLCVVYEAESDYATNLQLVTLIYVNECKRIHTTKIILNTDLERMLG